MKRPHSDFEKLREEIVSRLPKLSHRLQQIAHFALEHPHDIALQNIAMISSRIGVAPSAIIRFAKALDYRGFSDMQVVFRLPLSDNSLSSVNNGHLGPYTKWPGEACLSDAAAILEALLDTADMAIKQWVREDLPERLKQAIDLLAERHAVYIIGQGRLFSVAAYLFYELTHLQRHVHLLDGVGGMLSEQASRITDEDVLVALSFPPYTLEMADLVADAAAKGAAVIAITDSRLNPIAGAATVCLEVHERHVRGVPSLAATLLLVQALVFNVNLRRMKDQRADRRHIHPIRTGTK